MPDARDFLAGFGLTRGINLAGYRLDQASSTHTSIKRYHEYEYNITLEFTNLGAGIYNNLFFELMSLISGERIIYGIRNPYRCIIDPPQYGNVEQDQNGTVTFYLTGHSYRVYSK